MKTIEKELGIKAYLIPEIQREATSTYSVPHGAWRGFDGDDELDEFEYEEARGRGWRMRGLRKIGIKKRRRPTHVLIKDFKSRTRGGIRILKKGRRFRGSIVGNNLRVHSELSIPLFYLKPLRRKRPYALGRPSRRVFILLEDIKKMKGGVSFKKGQKVKGTIRGKYLMVRIGRTIYPLPLSKLSRYTKKRIHPIRPKRDIKESECYKTGYEDALKGIDLDIGMEAHTSRRRKEHQEKARRKMKMEMRRFKGRHGRPIPFDPKFCNKKYKAGYQAGLAELKKTEARKAKFKGLPSMKYEISVAKIAIADAKVAVAEAEIAEAEEEKAEAEEVKKEEPTPAKDATVISLKEDVIAGKVAEEILDALEGKKEEADEGEKEEVEKEAEKEEADEFSAEGESLWDKIKGFGKKGTLLLKKASKKVINVLKATDEKAGIEELKKMEDRGKKAEDELKERGEKVPTKADVDKKAEAKKVLGMPRPIGNTVIVISVFGVAWGLWRIFR